MHLQAAKVFLAAICLTALAAQAEPQGWGFTQAVGGISIGTPAQNEGQWLLPISSNVSGLEQVTTKPTTINSALGCSLTHAVIESNKIYLTIVTALTKKSATAKCPDAKLGALKPGKYSVFYRGPNEALHFLGEVAIGL